LKLIKKQLVKILDTENKKYETKALEYIGKLANGSVRDAISFLETSLLYSDEINIKNVIKVLGVLDIKTIRKIIVSPTIELINSIDETINGFRLSLLLIDELIKYIAEGNYQYKSILEKISEGLLSIKDPLLLNKYIRSIFITNLDENVSRETTKNEEADNSENVSRETNADAAENVDLEENVLAEETLINKEEEIEQEEIDPKIENKEENKKDVSNLKTIFDFVTAKEIIAEMSRNKIVELNMLRNKWVLLDEFKSQIDDKTIINLLKESKPLIYSDKMVIVGFSDE
jgi:DNA polymerase-3 subunit gamma/tau